MMIIAFTSIYLVTLSSVRKDINDELGRVASMGGKQDLGPAQNKFKQRDDNLRPMQEHSVTFTIMIDSNGEIQNVLTNLDKESSFYEEAKNKALANITGKGSCIIEDNDWMYIVMPHDGGKKLVFLNISSQQGILTNLVYTFSGVAVIMLIVIFFISGFFADRSIKPVKEAYDKQKQFVADASHELKTPLTVINTNVDVLLSNEDDNIRTHSKWLHYIKSEVERMTKLTNDLLYLTQVDYSEKKMIFSNLDFSETVENVILTMEAAIYEHNITFNYDIDPGLTVYGNSEQLQQVTMILLDNALKYTNKKGKIDVSLKKAHNSIVFSITNTGEGIGKEHLDKIFDRFYRTDKSRARESGGYGLGLSIAKAIVEQHKGRIYAKSTVNESTTFTFELPLGANS